MSDKIDFECTACGKCCRCLSENHNVIINNDDIRRISNHLKLSIDVFIQTYLTKFRNYKDESNNIWRFTAIGKCLFIGDDNLCAIHDVKPHQCRYTPFHFFWDGVREYECMLDVKVRVDWKSEEWDKKFLGITDERAGGDHAG